MNYFVIVYARKHFLSPMIKKSTTLVENGVELRPILPLLKVEVSEFATTQ
jgi:hypothetical protein